MSFFSSSLAAELNSFGWVAPKLLLHAVWGLTGHFSSGRLNQIKSLETAFLKQPVSHKAETIVCKKGREELVRLDIGPYLLQICWSLYLPACFIQILLMKGSIFHPGMKALLCCSIFYSSSLTIPNSCVFHQNLILYFRVLLLDVMLLSLGIAWAKVVFFSYFNFPSCPNSMCLTHSFLSTVFDTTYIDL